MKREIIEKEIIEIFFKSECLSKSDFFAFSHAFLHMHITSCLHIQQMLLPNEHFLFARPIRL